MIVTGRLRVRDWSSGERSGTSVDVVADAVGLDLGFGSAAFQRSQRAAVPRLESAPRDDASGGRAGAVGDGFSAGLPDGFQGGDAPASPGPDESDAGAPEREPAAAGVA